MYWQWVHDLKTIFYFADPIPLTDLEYPLALLRTMASQKLFLIVLNRGNKQLEIVNMDFFEKQVAQLWDGKEYHVGKEQLGIPISNSQSAESCVTALVEICINKAATWQLRWTIFCPVGTETVRDAFVVPNCAK